MIEPTEWEQANSHTQWDDPLDVLESPGAQMMADRRAAEVLEEVVSRIEAAIRDRLDGTDECERLLFSVGLIANGRVAELRGETNDWLSTQS